MMTVHDWNAIQRDNLLENWDIIGIHQKILFIHSMNIYIYIIRMEQKVKICYFQDIENQTIHGRIVILSTIITMITAVCQL